MVSPASSQQSQPMVNGSSSFKGGQSDNLAVLKLTPPSTNNRQHRTHLSHSSQNGGNVQDNGSNNNNFFTNHSNGSSHSGEFVVDFRKADIFNSNNSLNSSGSGSVKIKNSATETTKSDNKGDLNANFADFENNKIYNAAGEF